MSKPNEEKQTVTGADGTFARMTDKFIKDQNLGYLLNNLAKKYASTLSDDKQIIIRNTGNLLTHIKKKRMTFKTFSMLLQNVFKVKKLEVNVVITTEDDEVVSFSDTIIYDSELAETAIKEHVKTEPPKRKGIFNVRKKSD